MNTRLIYIVGILLAILSITIATAAAADPSAARIVPGDCIDGQFDVQITASGTGIGQIKESLCDGWTYVGSTMDPDRVSVSGNTVTFTVFSFPQTFTYTVQAPTTPGATCTISGIVKDTVNTAGVSITGQSYVSVCTEQNGPSDPSAARVVPGDCIDGQFDVQLTASGTGIGQIKETLCDGWTYVGSTMDPDQVSVSGNTVTFTVFSFPQTFTYTVQAPATPGATCTISGIVKDTVNTAGVPIAGQQVSVCTEQNGPSDPTATRVVAGDCVDGQFDVQITASGTGIGQIKETLCDGWTYVGSTMNPDQVSVSGNTVTFTLLSFPQTFTYTVQASATPGATCTISGIVKDTVNMAGVSITGQSYVSVCIPIESILLEEGWNLFSVPCVLENDTVEYVLEGVDYDAIVWYDASDQTWYIPVDIVPMTAYAIKVNETQTIENIECISEPIVPSSRHMYPGWNLVGLTSFMTKTAEFTFYAGGIDDSYSRVWGPWVVNQYVQLGYNKNVLDPGAVSGKDVYTENYIIKPYEGHWIFMEQNDTLIAIGP